MMNVETGPCVAWPSWEWETSESSRDVMLHLHGVLCILKNFHIRYQFLSKRGCV